MEPQLFYKSIRLNNQRKINIEFFQDLIIEIFISFDNTFPIPHLVNISAVTLPTPPTPTTTTV